MSVFGGDSWAREAQYRKRRVEDLVVESHHAASFKKLSNGKYACLLCPHHPILDSPLMFPTHCQGSKHQAAESRLKERELAKRDEVNKRIAFAEYPSGATSNSGTRNKKFKSATGKSLTKPARNLAAHEVLGGNTSVQAESMNRNLNQHDSKLSSSASHATAKTSANSNLDIGINSVPAEAQASEEVVRKWHLDYRERRERELKFMAAGWKRDCHGKWYKDENVEFDSDEEDPNVCLG
ncbi:Sodium channel modifier [Trema orientale]|uniref:Sodium channel modifier 1 n=1 Tax=Trema orientale TaxID=63057 RepID=A0A2P5FZ56_TREOI|nr:Sodium channel modifier [Trema orientale]